MTSAALPVDSLPTLDQRSRSCLQRYVDVLRDEVGPALLEIRLFGSVARGEEWPKEMPIRSDIDVLVVTEARLPEATVERLVNATYPLFLEGGRQIGPQFRTRAQVDAPRDERAAAFYENVRRDGILLWSGA
jgi:predicted nucleotidyltransferase